MVARMIMVSLAVLLVLGGITPTLSAAAPGDGSPPAASSAPKHPRLESSLAAMARAPQLAGETGETVRVIVELAAGVNPDAVRAGIVALGGTVEAEYADLLQVRAGAGALEGVAALPGIRWVRPPATAMAEAVSGQGVVATGANTWHTDGTTGSGVKVAIIDLGFSGYAALQTSGELPASVTTQDYCDGNLATGSVHGAAVAEIVHEMAPAAQLYLICARTEVQLGQAVTYAIAQGVQIISHSVSWFNGSRGDGSGGPGTPEGIAATARDAGILWVNSAGNYAQSHWSGTFSDTDGNNVHNYTPTDNGNTFFMDTGERVCAWLKWDSWPTTDQDYDLYIRRSATNALMSFSENEQTGTQPPVESACFTNTGPAENYTVTIARFSATATPRFDLFILYTIGGGGIEYSVSAGSLGDTASSPASLAVGAICWQDSSLESYSSRGPTVDGRIKPDIAGQDSVSSATYGNFSTCGNSGFTGTSAATPNVAGAAALVMAANPTFTPAQLQSYLEGRALDLGTAGKDSSFGAGRLWLDADPPHGLTYSAGAGGAVAASLPGSAFAAGTVVTLEATAEPTHRFTGWTLDGVFVGWANPLTITMGAENGTFLVGDTVIVGTQDTERVVQATFAPTRAFPSDVPSNHPNFTAITELASRGYILGYNQNSYGPGDGVQRAQMAVLIARATPFGPGTPTNGYVTPPGCTVAGTWDCEDWGNTFTDRGGIDIKLWRAAGTLQHYQVARGYTAADCAAQGRAFPCYGPTDPVSHSQTIAFITRAMIVKGYWVAQPNAPLPDPGVPAVLATEARTFAYYTGGLPPLPNGKGWNDGATRGWFAEALWAALDSYWGTDGNLPDGRPAGGAVP